MAESRWERLVWPQWLPVRARLPLIAQILGAVTLTALLAGPFWSTIAVRKPLAASSHPPIVPHATAITSTPPGPVAAITPSALPAHLNLAVHHSFGTVNFSVAVDGKPAFDTALTGSGKKFKMFGKRAERGFTKSFELAPGVHAVRVRVTSPADKFDQSRTERFDLESASVAAMQIAADRTGLSVVVQRPAAPPAPGAAVNAAVPAPAPPEPAPTPAFAPVAASVVPAADASLELLQTMRSMLIAIMGFVASAATGFVVQEFMRSRRGMLFDRRRKRRRREPASA